MYTTAIVLAGGKSSRMGADKLRLRVAEASAVTVLDHVVDVCTRIADRVLVAAGEHGQHVEFRHRVAYVHDKAAFRGPLQALSDVWMKLIDDLPLEKEDAYVLLAAGDLPGLHETVLERCREVLVASPPDIDAVLVTREGRWQPLVGCYKIRCGFTLREVAQKGEERMMRALDALHILPVSSEDAGWPDWWTRPIHTPTEYQEWLNRHHSLKSEGDSSSRA